MPQRGRIWQDLIDQRPEFRRVIELDQVAELMHDDIIPQVGRQEEQTIIEGKVAVSRTTPPARLLITDTDPSPGYAIEFLKISQTLFDQSAGRALGCLIFRGTPLQEQRLWPERLSRFLFTDPFLLALKEGSAIRIGNEDWQRHHDIPIAPERDPEPASPFTLPYRTDDALTQINMLLHISTVHIRTVVHLTRLDIGQRRRLDVLNDIRTSRKGHPSHRRAQHDNKKQGQS